MSVDAVPSPEVDRLTRNAPRATAGQVHRPNRIRLAKARPVGGHTGEALAFRVARESPKRPAP
jgi:hypothetical protein